MQRADDCLVIRYRDEMKESWDSFVAQAKNGSFLFMRNYMEYHRDRFDDHSLLFVSKAGVIACLPAHRIDDVLCSHRGLTFGGLVMHERIQLSQVMTIFDSLLDHMKSNGIRTLYYRHMPHPYHRLPAEEDIFVLSGLGAKTVETKATCVVPAGIPVRYSQGIRRAVKRFATAGLTLRRSFDFAAFIAHCETYLWRRRGARPVHTGAELEHLAALFPDNILLYVVERNSNFEGGLVVYRNAVCAKAQYVAQTTFGQEAQIMPAIYHHVSTKVLPTGTMFDLGPSNDPATGLLDESLHWYKESFGARTILLSSYQLSVG
jgi:hypothetical protein